jgi:beta-RFAP synthase
MHEPELAAETLARRAGRGLRSAVGLHGFLRGGFLVDGGRAESGRLGTLVARVDFPEEWRFVLAMPHRSIGLSGEAEQSTFASQPSMPIGLTSELCRTVLMDWLPSVIESDFSRCSDSMYRFGTTVGEFFSNAQGGVFSHPRMRQWAELVRSRGVSGVAQTSWGPTLAALCCDEKSAEQLKNDFANDSSWSDCSFQVVTPLNCAASVSISERNR